MLDPIITCPNCKTEIKLTEQLAAPLLTKERAQYEQSLAKIRTDFEKRESEVRLRELAVSKSKEQIDEQVAAKLKAERARIATEAERNAKLTLQSEMEGKDKSIADLTGVVGELNRKLGEAQIAQAELTRAKRQLDHDKQALELTVEQRVLEQLSAERQRARQEAESELGLKLMEREQTIESMKRQLADAQRKAEQGSQQLQGEAQELELEALLRAKFRADDISAVAKGELGADIVQRVVNSAGQHCGTILWESKRTKNWSDTWLPKLRDDQRNAKADIAVIVSRALPKNVETFDLVDGVYVSNRQCALALAVALRGSLIELSAARQAAEGQMTKSQMVYQYLTGPQFKQRVGAIVEKFTEMRTDLENEKRNTQKQWAKREKLIDGILASTAGMYGDLQGITAKSLDEIEGLDFPLLDAPEAA